MRCLICGADSSVKSTRPFLVYFIKRVRQCFNEHTFTTFEVPPSICNVPDMRARMRGMQARIDRYKTRKLITASTLPTSDLMRLTGLSRTHVRRIRACSTDS